MLTVKDLPERGNGRGISIMCSAYGPAHGSYSPDRGDYFMASPDTPITCSECGEPMELVQTVTKYRRVKA